jgi:hypothetical protein
MKGCCNSFPFFLTIRENAMSFGHRILLCVGIVLIDLIVFFLPLTALFLAYIVLYNPPWFREFLQELK